MTEPNLDAIFAERMPGRFKLILIDLARRAGPGGWVRAKSSTLATDTQCNPENLRAALRDLDTRGMITADPLNKNGVMHSYRVDPRFLRESVSA
jgi:hypothetical protein